MPKVSVSPGSPKDGRVASKSPSALADDERKQLEYRLLNSAHDLELEKVKCQQLEEDVARFKKQIIDGEKRNEKIRAMSKAFDDHQKQLAELR